MNVDPLNGAPPPVQLQSRGFTQVRLVSKPEHEDYAVQCRVLGIEVLAVVARESEDYILVNADIVQLGNEADHESDSSWTMAPAEYVAWANRMYPECYEPQKVCLAGMANGMPQSWLPQVLPYLTFAPDYLAVHPYAKGVEDGRAMLAEYVAFGVPLLISEWWQPEEAVAPFLEMLREFTDQTYFFCWTDAMVPGLGLVDAQGNPKHALLALEDAMATQYKYTLGIANEVSRLRQAGVDPGEPLENETYPFPGAPYSFQATEKGLMLYSVQGNKSYFFPGAALGN